jgi:hypothetical protein
MEGQNMLTMLQAENATTPQERDYAKWERKVTAILGVNPFPAGSEDESVAFDLYMAGSDPTEAAAELEADWEARAAVRAEGRAERCLSPGYGS